MVIIANGIVYEINWCGSVSELKRIMIKSDEKGEEKKYLSKNCPLFLCNPWERLFKMHKKISRAIHLRRGKRYDRYHLQICW